MPKRSENKVKNLDSMKKRMMSWRVRSRTGISIVKAGVEPLTARIDIALMIKTPAKANPLSTSST